MVKEMIDDTTTESSQRSSISDDDNSEDTLLSIFEFGPKVELVRISDDFQPPVDALYRCEVYCPVWDY